MAGSPRFGIQFVLVLLALSLVPQVGYPQQSPERMWALVIGVSNYVHARPLQYAADDALAFSEFLKSARGGGVPEDHIFTLLEDGASRFGILTELNDMAKRVQPGDVVYVYIAGHGLLVNRSGYFIPSDGDFAQAVSGGIYVGHIKGMIEDGLAHANVRVLITDMCNAGRIGTNPLQPAEKIANELNDEILRFHATQGSFLNLMASGATEPSFERSDLGHGVFTYSLLEALNGKASGNVPMVTAGNVVSYLRAEVPRLTQLGQTPVVNVDFDPNLILAFTDRPGPPPRTDAQFAVLVLQNTNRSTYTRVEWVDPRTQRTIVRQLPKDRDSTQIAFLNAGNLELRLYDGGNNVRSLSVNVQSGRNTLDLSPTSGWVANSLPVQIVSTAIRGLVSFFQAAVPTAESAVIVQLNPQADVFLDGVYFGNSGQRATAFQLSGLSPGVHQLRVVPSPDREYRFRLRLFPGLHLLDITTGELRYVLETATFQSAVPRGLPPAVNDLYQRFDTAIREERLIPPARDSAWDAYLALRSQVSANIRGTLERRLVVAMGDRSQRIVLKYLRGGDIKWNASIFDEGATLFTRVQQLYRQLPDLDSGRFFFEGRALIERNKYDDAVQRLERSVSLEPNASHSLNAIGLALWKQNRLNLATQPLQQAIAVTPRWNYPRNTLSLIYMEQRRYAEAENVFQLAINNDPEDSTAHHGLAQLYLLLNRRDEAETQLQGAIEFNPGNAYAYETYGKLRQLQGRLAEAEDYLRLSIRLEPDEPAFRATLAGMLQGQAGRAAEAADMFGQLARLDTDSVAVATALVPFFAQPDQFRQGDEFFDRSIKRSSGDPNMRVVYGGLLLKRGRFKSAERQFRAAVRRNPENAFALYDLGVTYLSQRKLGEAEAALDRAVIVDPRFSNSHQLRGQVRYAQQRFVEAEDEYRKAFALSIEPTQQQELCDLLVEARRGWLQRQIDDARNRTRRGMFNEAWVTYSAAVNDTVRDLQSINGSCGAYLNADDLRVSVLADVRDAVVDFDEAHPGYARLSEIDYSELSDVLQSSFWKARRSAEMQWTTAPVQAAATFSEALARLDSVATRVLGSRAFNFRNTNWSIHQVIYTWAKRALERRDYSTAISLMDGGIRSNFFCVVAQSPITIDGLIVPVRAQSLSTCTDFEIAYHPDRRAHEIYAAAYAGIGQTERSKLYLEALETGGPDVLARTAVAEAFGRSGSWGEALSTLTVLEMRLKEPQIPMEVFAILGEAYCQTGKCMRGRDILTQGLRRFPGNKRLRDLMKKHS